MQLSFPAFIFLSLFLIHSSHAAHFDGTLNEKISLFPQCAQKCMSEALDQEVCNWYDGHCVCTSEAFRSQVTMCVVGGCTLDDILATQKLTVQICGGKQRDQSHRTIIVTIVMSATAALFVLLRWTYKLSISKLPIEMDDWFALASLLAAIPNCVLTVRGSVANGLGKDSFNLSSEEIVSFARYLYIMTILYYTEATLIKLTFISFYRRLFPPPGVQRLLWATFIFTALYGLTFVLVAIFQCQPANYFWEKFTGEDNDHGVCMNAHIISFCNASIGIALDLWILAVPLAQLPGLQLHWKKKLSVGLMFFVGTFVTVVSMIRLKALVDFTKTANSTYAFASVNTWSTIEICVGVMCACLPTLRLLLVRSFPALSGSTQRSSQWTTGSQPKQPSGFGPDRGSTMTKAPSMRRMHEASCRSVRLSHLPPVYDDDTSGILVHKETSVVSSDEIGNDVISLINVEREEEAMMRSSPRTIAQDRFHAV